MVYPVLLSAYAALLFRLSAEQELAIGILSPDQAASYLSLQIQGKLTFSQLFHQVSDQLQD